MKVKEQKNKVKRLLLIVIAFIMLFSVTPTEVLALSTGDSITIVDDGISYNYTALYSSQYRGAVVSYWKSDNWPNPVFCGQHGLTDGFNYVNNRTRTLTITREMTNDNVRKVLYYGYGGPKEWNGFEDYWEKYSNDGTQGKKFKEPGTPLVEGSDEYLGSVSRRELAGTGITANTLSLVINWAAGQNGHPNGDMYSYDGVSQFVDYIDSQSAPPDNFKVYEIGNTDSSYQNFYTFEIPKDKSGVMYLQKKSNTVEGNDITTGNSYYGSINDAVYGVYRDSACTDWFFDLKANKRYKINFANGVVSKTYYVKEKTAPYGYHKDNNTYSITVTSDNTEDNPATLTLTNTPIGVYPGLLLQKQKEDGSTVGLKGAQYSVNFYAGEYTETTLPATPTRSWTMETDSLGQIKLDTEHVVSGDILYKDYAGKCFLPCGTLAIWETKAPEGYQIDPTKYVGAIKHYSPYYNTPTSTEKPAGGEFYVEKTPALVGGVDITAGNSCYGNMSEARYNLYRDAACEDLIETIQPGKRCSVSVGTYYLRESIAPKGYIKDTTVHKFTVTKSNTSSNPLKVSVKDVPGTEPVDILLKKQSENGSTVGLAGAEYTFKYYAGEYTEATLPAAATKTWVMKIDADGYIKLDATYLVSGDNFYYSDSGKPVLPYGTVSIKETKAPAGFELDPKTYVVPVGHTGIEERYNAPTSTEKSTRGSIGIKKVDNFGNPLEGVEFTVYTDAECKNAVKTIVTDAKGEAIYGYDEATKLHSLLPGATYYLKETKGLPGHEMSKETFVIKVVSNMTTWADKEAVNFKYGSIGIKKTDNLGNPLSGVEFGVYTDAVCTKLVSTITTKADGTATYGYDETTKLHSLLPGVTYYLKETKGMPGYEMSKETFTIKVVSGMTIWADKTAVNQKYGSIGVKKTDNLGNPLEGVEFTVYSDAECKNPVKDGVITTNAKGEAIYGYDEATKLHSLLPGATYYLKETKGIPGYEMSKDLITIKVVSGMTVWAKEGTPIINIRYGSIGIKKVDNTGELLSGVEFTVYSDEKCENPVATITTGEDGIALYGYDEETKLHSLLPGVTYYLKETKGLPGFEMTKETFAITVVSGKTTMSSTDALNIRYGSIGLKKVSTSGEPLEGVEFGVYEDAECEKLLATIVTGEDGIALYGYDEETKLHSLLPDVKYYLKETKTLKSYKLSDEVFEFTVVTGKTTMLEKDAVNEKLGAISITKLNAMRRPLPGVKIGVYSDKECNNLLEELVTDKNGYAYYGYDVQEKAFLLEVGTTYYFKELELPPTESDGTRYYLSDEIVEITVTEPKDLEKGIAKGNIAHAELINYAKEELMTKALAGSGLKEALPSKETTVVDRVLCKNLRIGKEYTVNGTLHAIDDMGRVFATAVKTFIATAIDTVVELEFKFDSSLLMGKTIVIFEYLSRDGKQVATHADVNYKDQQVDFPKVETSLESGSVTVGKDTVITDIIYYEKLTPGVEYEAEGVLMDKATGEPFRLDGKEIRAAVRFTPTEENGTVSVAFRFDSTGLEGKTLVVFETIRHAESGVTIGEHRDMDDLNQTVTFIDVPKMGDAKDIGDITAPIIGCVSSAMLLMAVLSTKRRKLEL